MAIAFYVPREYGPLDQEHQQQQQGAAAGPRIVHNIHQHHFEQGNNNDVNVKRNVNTDQPEPLSRVRRLADQNQCLPSIDIQQGEDAATPPSPSSSRKDYSVGPSSPASSQHHPSTMTDFVVSVTLQVSVTQQNECLLLLQEEEEPQVVPASPEELYRIEGSRLRAIADNFVMTRNSRRRRVSPSSQSTFRQKLAISVALPTVALVALGLFYI